MHNRSRPVWGDAVLFEPPASWPSIGIDARRIADSGLDVLLTTDVMNGHVAGEFLASAAEELRDYRATRVLIVTGDNADLLLTPNIVQLFKGFVAVTPKSDLAALMILIGESREMIVIQDASDSGRAGNQRIWVEHPCHNLSVVKIYGFGPDLGRARLPVLRAACEALRVKCGMPEHSSAEK